MAAGDSPPEGMDEFENELAARTEELERMTEAMNISPKLAAYLRILESRVEALENK